METTSVFASQDPRVFAIGVPRGIPRVKHAPLGGVGGTGIGLNTSDSGEGVFRWDSRTNAFSCTTPAFQPPSLHPFGKQPASDDYQKNLGPDKYGVPPYEAHSKAKKHCWTANSKQRRFWMSNAEAYQKSLPSFEFDLAGEDSRHWAKTELAHDFNSDTNRKGMDTKSPCESEFYETDAPFKALDPESFPRNCETSFVSTVPRLPPPPIRVAKDIDPFHLSAIGPGMYGIPKDPRVEWGKDESDIPREDPSFITTRTKSRRSVMEESMQSVIASSTGGENDSEAVKKARAAAEHLETVGPGQYWTPTRATNEGSVSPERTQQNESKKGTAGIVGTARVETKLQKDVSKWRADIPTAHYTHRKEAKTWREGKGAHTMSRSSLSAQVGAASPLRWEKVDEKPRSLSRSISIKRIKEAMSDSRALQRSMSQQFGPNASKEALRYGGGGTRRQKAARRSQSQNSFLPPANETCGYWPTDVLRSKSQASQSPDSAEEHSLLLQSKLGVDISLSSSASASGQAKSNGAGRDSSGFNPQSDDDWEVEVHHRQLALDISRPATPGSSTASGG